MDESSLDPKVRNTLYLLFGSIVYLVVIVAILQRLSGFNEGLTTLFALALLPLIAILVMVWGYGLRLRMPGINLEYYPVEKIMKAPSIISGDITGKEAEELMEKDKTDFLNILDRNGLFQGIITKTDVHNARIRGKIKDKVKNISTIREKVIHASERENLKNVMEKIGKTKHSRLPVLDKNNRLMGVVDAVDITDLLSMLLR